jgi:hypothetical protein
MGWTGKPTFYFMVSYRVPWGEEKPMVRKKTTAKGLKVSSPAIERTVHPIITGERKVHRKTPWAHHQQGENLASTG